MYESGHSLLTYILSWRGVDISIIELSMVLRMEQEEMWELWSVSTIHYNAPFYLALFEQHQDFLPL